MALCSICGTERFLLYRKYQGVKFKPPRCIGCIVRFPPDKVNIYANNDADLYELRPWLEERIRYHAWTLIKQTKKIDIWFCPFCRKSLMSKKLGVPSGAGCIYGQNFISRKTWNVDIKRVTVVLCPLCDKLAVPVTIKRLLKKRSRKHIWPYTCRSCYADAE